MKIAVIGYSGSGKSTLTKNLAKGLRIPPRLGGAGPGGESSDGAGFSGAK